MGRNGAPKAVFSRAPAALQVSSDAPASHFDLRLAGTREKTVKTILSSKVTL
jgi:hypothetical protein